MKLKIRNGGLEFGLCGQRRGTQGMEQGGLEVRPAVMGSPTWPMHLLAWA